MSTYSAISSVQKGSRHNLNIRSHRGSIPESRSNNTRGSHNYQNSFQNKFAEMILEGDDENKDHFRDSIYNFNKFGEK